MVSHGRESAVPSKTPKHCRKCSTPLGRYWEILAQTKSSYVLKSNISLRRMDLQLFKVVDVDSSESSDSTDMETVTEYHCKKCPAVVNHDEKTSNVSQKTGITCQKSF